MCRRSFIRTTGAGSIELSCICEEDTVGVPVCITTRICLNGGLGVDAVAFEIQYRAPFEYACIGADVTVVVPVGTYTGDCLNGGQRVDALSYGPQEACLFEFPCLCTDVTAG